LLDSIKLLQIAKSVWIVLLWFNTSSIKIIDGEFDVIERGLFTGFDKLTDIKGKKI
jgi:hypothetical protein